MQKHQQDTVKLLDGAIVLYKRGDLKHKAAWHCRIELGNGKRKRQSLKTQSQEVAQRLAMELYTELKGRIVANLPLNSIPFDKFWDERWIPYVERNLSEHRHRLHLHTGRRYIKPYFANCALDGITVRIR